MSVKAYVGTKIIQAEPQDNPNLKAGEPAQPGYRVLYPDGYVSWSPKHTFEEAYREISFGERNLVMFGDEDLEKAVNYASDDHVHNFADYDMSMDDDRCRCGKYKHEFEREQREANP